MACLLAAAVVALPAVPLPGDDDVGLVSTAQAHPNIPELTLVCWANIGGDDLIVVGCRP